MVCRNILHPMVIVFKSNNIVFAEIIPVLDFDYCYNAVCPVFEAMYCALWDYGGFALSIFPDNIPALTSAVPSTMDQTSLRLL